MNLARCCVLLAFLAVPPSKPTAAGGVIPDTPAGRVAAAWFDAFNGTENEMLRMIERHFVRDSTVTREERLARWHRMRDEVGSLTPVRLIAADERNVETLARDGHDGWVRVHLFVSEEAPPRIASVEIDRAGPEDAATPLSGGPLSLPQALDSLTRAVDALAAADRFSGVVRVERGGEVLLEHAWGEADREDRVANRVDTKFNLGSINKTFTRALIAKLVEQGRISPDDRLSKFLPDFPRDQADRITIQQLLDMRSGLGDVFGPRYFAADKSKLRNPRDWFPLFVGDSLRFEPGTSEAYSNAGYIVLGAVAEAVTARSYYDLVRDWIYRPAGMEDSDSFGRDEKVPNRATGYTRQVGDHSSGGPLRSSTPGQPGRGSPAGGGWSTARDLSRYVAALGEGKILKPETVERFFDTRPGPSGRPVPAFGIAGGSPGVNADLESDGTWTVVVLANLDPPAATAVGRQARGFLQRVH